MLRTAFGLLGLSPAVFWRLTLAEWRAMLHGYDERQGIAMRKSAWVVSHLLIAAGCDAEKVTIDKLLGEKERKGKRALSADERKVREAEKLRKRLQRDKEKRENGRT